MRGRKAGSDGRRKAAASPLEAGVHSFGAASSLKQLSSSMTRHGFEGGEGSPRKDDLYANRIW